MTTAHRLRTQCDVTTAHCLRTPSGMTTAQRLRAQRDMTTAHCLRTPSGLTTAHRLRAQSGMTTAYRLRAQRDMTTAQRLRAQRDMTTAHCLRTPSGMTTAQRLHCEKPHVANLAEVAYVGSCKDNHHYINLRRGLHRDRGGWRLTTAARDGWRPAATGDWLRPATWGGRLAAAGGDWRPGYGRRPGAASDLEVARSKTCRCG